MTAFVTSTGMHVADSERGYVGVTGSAVRLATGIDLDITNGLIYTLTDRVTILEEAKTELEERVKNLEQLVFEMHERSRSD